MPTRNLEKDVCAVCGNKVLTIAGEEGVLENTYKLSCDHVYPFQTVDVFFSGSSGSHFFCELS